MAAAVSASDLLEQVKKRCPNETHIPSESWLRLQFWPKTSHARSKIHYTGKLNIKFMVQARQFRKDHPDSHYAAALIRYQKEYAILFKEHCNFLSIDDKHKVKIGEPGFPVAAAERGKRVIVSRNSTFEVGDHDFTGMGIIPSVCLLIDVPEKIEDAFYHGRVSISLKDAVFEASSPSRHAAEMYKLIDHKPVLFLYCDGGPDHRLTYVSVQLSLIALFCKLDLDYLCVCRTAPFHSWKNPVERIMSLVNLELQSVGLMRQQTEEEYEAIINKCNNMEQLRHAAKSKPEVKEKLLDSIEPVKIMLSDIFTQLKWNERTLEVHNSATENEIQEFWEIVKEIDSTLLFDKRYRKCTLKDHPKLQEFLSHCCQTRHYSFSIKKCGKPDCQLCKPPRLPAQKFDKLSHIPDPVPGIDGHYLSFTEVFGKSTDEKHRPSLQKSTRRKSLPFVASVQHANNTGLLVQCEECEMWRLVYAPCKLSSADKCKLSECLQEHTFTCGANLSDMNLTENLCDVCVRDLSCYDPVERLYYSVKNYEPICIYCSSTENLIFDVDLYPQCKCCTQQPVKKRK